MKLHKQVKYQWENTIGYIPETSKFQIIMYWSNAWDTTNIDISISLPQLEPLILMGYDDHVVIGCDTMWYCTISCMAYIYIWIRMISTWSKKILGETSTTKQIIKHCKALILCHHQRDTIKEGCLNH